MQNQFLLCLSVFSQVYTDIIGRTNHLILCLDTIADLQPLYVKLWMLQGLTGQAAIYVVETSNWIATCQFLIAPQ